MTARWRISSIFFAAFFLCAIPTGHGQTYEGRELVQAALVADVTAVVPGKPFTVGARLREANVGKGSDLARRIMSATGLLMHRRWRGYTRVAVARREGRSCMRANQA